MLNEDDKIDIAQSYAQSKSSGFSSSESTKKAMKAKSQPSVRTTLRRACTTLQQIDDGSTGLFITEDLNATLALESIVGFMKELKTCNNDLFTIQATTRGKALPLTDPLGERFLRLCGNQSSSITLAYPLHNLNPWAHAFLKAVWTAKATDPNFQPTAPYSANVHLRFNSLNRVIAALRSAITTESFRKDEEKWTKRTTRARARFFRVFKNALAQHARVLVIRIDFGLKRHEYANPKEPLALDTPEESRDGLKEALLKRLNFKEIDTAREKTLRQVRETFGASLLGYIWKLEFGARKGFHYHCVFLLNGSVHRQDISIGNQIGKFWQRYAPHGLGLFWNCNAHRQQYKFPALGTIRYHESGHWRGLNHIADYLSKPDFLASLKLPAGRRTFGSSELHGGPKVSRGPQRSKTVTQGFTPV